MVQMAALEIVWRNPKPSQRQQRWEQIQQNSATVHYVVQELVSISDGSVLDRYVELGNRSRRSSILTPTTS